MKSYVEIRIILMTLTKFNEVHITLFLQQITIFTSNNITKNKILLINRPKKGYIFSYIIQRFLKNLNSFP